MQSSEVVDTLPASSSAPELSEGTKAPDRENLITFHDEAEAPLGGFVVDVPRFGLTDKTVGVDLAKFMQRPMRVASLTWTDGTAVANRWSYYPWHLYFTNPVIQNKLQNYAFIRCKLKVKIILNASPFLYGALMAYYEPLVAYRQNSIVKFDAATRWFITASQLPHRMLYPHESQGAEMELPFLYHKNWLPTSLAAEFQNMGQLTVTNMTLLRSANAAASQSITAAIYVWAEDVELSGPTVGLTLQGMDEYGTGPISAPASALADVAGRLKGVPFLSRFATATEIGASAVSRIAKLFGFTNVPVIADIHSMQPVTAPPLASTEIGFPIQKLTFDPKNELSISPSDIGCGNVDELAIEHIVQREAFFYSQLWTTGQAQGALIFRYAVTPNVIEQVAGSGFSTNYPTPTAWLGRLFRYWRGDLIIRIRVISSQYHKGRLLIAYDPLGTSASNLPIVSNTEGQVFTQIVDIGEQGDIEIRIPYQQAFPWLINENNWGSYVFPYGNDASWVNDDTRYNGTLTVRVLTKLTAPVPTADVPILFYIRGAENLEFASPIEVGENISALTVQSQDVYDETSPSEIIDVGGGTGGPDPHRYRMNHGEAVKSLRTLLRRFNLSEVYLNSAANSQPCVIYKDRFSRFPLQYGYDTHGIHSAKGTVTPASNFAYNFTKNTVFNYLAPAFIGLRGSTFWHINVESQEPLSVVSVVRAPWDTGDASRGVTYQNSTSVSGHAAFHMANLSACAAGAALTNQRTSASLSVGCPNYTLAKFEYCNPYNFSSPTISDGTAGENLVLNISTNNSIVANSPTMKVFKYFSVGTDFNFFFFLAVPCYYSYSTPLAN